MFFPGLIFACTHSQWKCVCFLIKGLSRMFFICYFILQDSSDNTSLGKNSSDSSKLLIINHNLVFLIQLKAHPIHILLTLNFLWEKKRKRNNTCRCPSFLRNLSTNPPIVKDILNLSFLKNTK